MNISKKLLLITLIATGVTTGVHSMGHAKKAASAAGTVAYYSLAGCLCAEGIERLLAHANNDTPDDTLIEATSVKTPEPLQNFVRNVIHREGVENPYGINVRIHTDPQSPYAAAPNTIFIDLNEALRLTNCFTSPIDNKFKIKIDNEIGCSTHVKWTNKEYIIRSIAMVTHEAAHLKNNDAASKTAACFVIPTLTLLASRYKPILTLTNKGFFTKVATGILLNEINSLIYSACSRYQEYRADDAITETAEMIMFIKVLHADSHAYPPNPSIYGLLKDSHPDPRKRMARIASRLQDNDSNK